MKAQGKVERRRQSMHSSGSDPGSSKTGPIPSARAAEAQAMRDLDCHLTQPAHVDILMPEMGIEG